ncbi:MAG: thiamine pyrophosphate-requiring protein [Micromonosporaceae bacterium]|nr:thiamine pyrophosphate-requiring protein [Micromonosporaceae bacterium]
MPQPHTQRSLGPRGVAVAELLLRTLAAHGINRLWFCSGSELVPIQEAAVRLRERGAPTPEIAPVTHEHVAIAAAMGESMISGRPAAVVAHADLGPLNFGAELHTALRGGYPLLLISGYPATNPERRTSQAFWNQQRWDQGAIFRQYTKWDYKVSAHEEVGTVIARALQVALTPPQGPVYLVFPAEVLAQDHVLGDVVTADELGVGQHGGGEAEAVRALARRILDAEHPLLITERVGRDPAAVAELAALCEEFGIAARTTRYRMSLPSDHPAHLGAPDVTAADVVVVVDHHVPWIPAHGGPPADAFVSVVGVDPVAAEVPLHEFRAHQRLFAAAGPFLRDLRAELTRAASAADRERARRRWQALQDTAATVSQERERRRREARELPHLTPAGLSACVDEVIAPTDILIDELGDTAELVRRSLPGTLFMNGGSSLGWATSAAVGASLASGGTPVFCLTGDGGYLFGGPQAALWAQRRYDAPVLTVVANNGGYRTGTSHVDDYYPDGAARRAGDYTGGRFDPVPDHAREAEACGALGFTVRTPGELLDALRRGRAAVTQDRRPVVIDALLPDHLGRLPRPTGVASTPTEQR